MVDFRVAAKAFIVEDGKLLVLKRRPNDIQKPGIWEIPGGRLNLGENPFEGVKRETKEETGIDIDVLHPLNVKHFKRDDGQTITLLIFLCKALTDNVKISEEHSDFKWMHLKNYEKELSEFFHKEVEIFNKLELHKHL